MAAQRSAIAESHYSCSLLGALDVQFKNITASLEQHVLPPNQNPISHLKRRLQSLQQGNKTCTEYLNQAKSWADELSAVGKPVEDDDLISLVINRINPTYNSFVTAFILRDRETIFHDFQSELLSHEILLQNQQQALNPEVGSFALHAHRSCPPHSPIAFRNSPNTIPLPSLPEILPHPNLIIPLPTTILPVLPHLHDSTPLVRFVGKAITVPWTAIISWTTPTKADTRPWNLLP